MNQGVFHPYFSIVMASLNLNDFDPNRAIFFTRPPCRSAKCLSA
jgi:hypothetical protein